MDFKRRALIGALCGWAGALNAAQHSHRHSTAQLPPPTRPPRALPQQSEKFVSPLRIPGATGLMALVRADQPLRLVARYGRHTLFPGRPTDMLLHHLDLPGSAITNPVLRVKRGQNVDVTLANLTGEDTTIHWHGLTVDERNDGSGMHPVHHNESRAYQFKVFNRAGLYWYHPHPHDRTGAQVHLGLGSLFLVEDDDEDALRRELGLEFGDTEIPLMVQDKQVDDRNKIRFSMGEDDWIGNRMFVNWTPEPVLNARTCLYRFRILNGSNARTFLLAFVSAGRKIPFTLIGADGGLFDKPREVSETFFAPAQRLDVLIDFSKLVSGSTVRMTSLQYDPMENDGGPAIDPAIEHPGAPPLGDPVDLMLINIKVPVCATRTIPSTLSSLPALRKPTSPARRFRLHMDGPKWLINGYNFHDDMRAVKVRVRRGTVEHWDIRNDMKSMPHPMHLHGFQFQVLERRGSPAQVRKNAVTRTGLGPYDLGLHDTVLVWPGETVRIGIDFSQPFSGTQKYMFHCHNLEHEDQGMMLHFAVT